MVKSTNKLHLKINQDTKKFQSNGTKGYSRNDCTLPQDRKLIVFNMVVVKQTLTTTTHLDRVEIKNCWWLVIKVFGVLGWSTIISGLALSKKNTFF